MDINKVKDGISELAEKYEKKIECKMSEMEKINGDDKWKFQKEKYGIKMWKKKISGSKIVMFKTSWFLEGVTAKEYYEHYYGILDAENWKEIKKRTKTSLFYKIVKKIKHEFYLIHTCADTGKLVANREFVYFRKTKHHDDEDNVITVICYPVDPSDDYIVVKSSKSIVRGILMMGHSFENKTIKEKKGVVVTKWMHTDPKGWLPGALINSLAGGTAIDVANKPRSDYIELMKKNKDEKK